jgi:hypothetical protein
MNNKTTKIKKNNCLCPSGANNLAEKVKQIVTKNSKQY